MALQFVWENFDHPQLKVLKEKYSLEKIVAGGKDEFEKQLLLKKWVFDTLPLGYNNSNQYKNALEVLEDRGKTRGFNCTWYVLVYLQCAIALGWYVRKLGIDINHESDESEKKHTVVDIWSADFKKWYVIDPMFNVHFEKEGVPLNAFEVRREYLNKHDIQKVFGNYEKEKLPEKVKDHHDNSANYFWFFVLARNNYFENSNVYDSKALLWVDEFNREKLEKHPVYNGNFIPSNDLGLFYPSLP